MTYPFINIFKMFVLQRQQLDRETRKAEERKKREEEEQRRLALAVEKRLREEEKRREIEVGAFIDHQFSFDMRYRSSTLCISFLFRGFSQ